MPVGVAGELECLEDHEKLERVEGIELLLHWIYLVLCRCVKNLAKESHINHKIT